MPAAGTTGQRRSGPLPTVLFWSGVGLAPLAALLLLVGQGSLLLPIGAVLALLAGVLFAVSITLRQTGVNVRAEVEGLVFDEIDALRDDIRDDISHAARATHKSLADRIVTLSDTVDALRGQIDVMRGQIERAASAPSPPANTGQHQAAPGGLLRHTETVQVTTRQTMVVDPNEAQRDGTVYGSSRHSTDYAGGRSQGGEYGTPRPPDFEGRAQVPFASAPVPPAPQIPQQRRPPERAMPAIEASPREESWTEQLLRERLSRREPDRQPADRSGEWSRRDSDRQPADRSGEWSRREPDRQPADRSGEWSTDRRREGLTTDRLTANPLGGDRWSAWSASDQRPPAEPYDPERTGGGRRRATDPEETYDPERTGGGRRRAYDQEETYDPERTSGGRRAYDPESTGGGRRRAADPEETYDPERTGGGRRRAYELDEDNDDRVTGLRTSDRWASVRSDDRGGRELQMGERRTAMREDARGTELRIEDRWASVRREEARRESEGPRRSAASRERERDWSDPDPGDRAQPRERGVGRAALPAGPSSDRSGEWTRAGRPVEDERTRGGRTSEDEWTRGGRAVEDERVRGGWAVEDERVRGGRAGEDERTRRPGDGDWSQRGRTGEWSAPGRDDERASRHADRPADRSGERPSRRYRVDDTDYRWNGVREEARGQTGRRLVDFEGNDDRWR